MLPYDYYHRQIIIYLVYYVVRMINAVPSKVGILLVEHHHGGHRSWAYVQIFRQPHKIIHNATHQHMNRKSILNQMV